MERKRLPSSAGAGRLQSAGVPGEIPRAAPSSRVSPGVMPLVISTGSGSEMRQAVGVAVFFGMLGVTLFGLIFTPIFYMVVRNLAEGKNEGKPT